MAIKFEKTQVKGGFPVFWRGEREVLPGDFAVKGTYPEGTILKEGTPIKLDFENMECTICKSARIVEGGTTTKPRVIKGSMFQINDAVKVGDSSGTIKSISTANESYDEITLSAAMTEAVAGADLLGGDEIPDAVIEKGIHQGQWISDCLGSLWGANPQGCSIPHPRDLAARLQYEKQP